MSKGTHGSNGPEGADPWIQSGLLTPEFKRPPRVNWAARVGILAGMLVTVLAGFVLGVTLFRAPHVAPVGPHGGVSDVVTTTVDPTPSTVPADATVSPAQRFAQDLQAHGGPPASPADVSLVQADTPLLCGLIRSGMPMTAATSGPNQGVTPQVVVNALNDSHLCGSAPVSLPPTSW